MRFHEYLTIELDLCHTFSDLPVVLQQHTVHYPLKSKPSPPLIVTPESKLPLRAKAHQKSDVSNQIQKPPPLNLGAQIQSNLTNLTQSHLLSASSIHTQAQYKYKYPHTSKTPFPSPQPTNPQSRSQHAARHPLNLTPPTSQPFNQPIQPPFAQLPNPPNPHPQCPSPPSPSPSPSPSPL